MNVSVVVLQFENGIPRADRTIRRRLSGASAASPADPGRRSSLILPRRILRDVPSGVQVAYNVVVGQNRQDAFRSKPRFRGRDGAAANDPNPTCEDPMLTRIVPALLLIVALFAAGAHAQTSAMTFFVTSANPGKGADFGGLEGADRHCQALAEAAGSKGRAWRAYLSAGAQGGQAAVNARDRIGKGPWHNAKGVLIAKDVAELHGSNQITKQTALSEKGDPVNGRGDSPNLHDVLTGSTPEGNAFAGSDDRTCGNWTKSGEGSAMVGHHDRVGLGDTDAAKSWNSSHATRGCSMDALRSTGGGGLIYCFATN
jgi:hypothetical protein